LTGPSIRQRVAIIAPPEQRFASSLATHLARQGIDVEFIDATQGETAERYDAFLFFAVTTPGMLRAFAAVSQRAIVVVLPDDIAGPPSADFTDIIVRARVVLCTTQIEGTRIGELFGPAVRARTTIIGPGVDSAGWQRAATLTAQAVDSLGLTADGRSREALLAQIGHFYPVISRQRRTIAEMRLSRFWKLRDLLFSLKRKLGIGPVVDPVGPLSTEDRVAETAALGDSYQLFRELHRLRVEDVDRMRAMAAVLPKRVTFGLVVDARNASADAVRTTLASLRDQIYEEWSARIIVDDGPGSEADDLRSLAAEDTRVVLLHADEAWLGDTTFVGALDPYDRLEPHALFEFALALQADLDIVYCDEDRIGISGLPHDPWFKPDWSPETFLGRDYAGHLCVVRSSLLGQVGGLAPNYGTALWYEALLRVTERDARVFHITQVLCHTFEGSRIERVDQRNAVEAALVRRGESATIEGRDAGFDVRFAPGDERVCVVIATRDRADLLGPCIRSLFERTSYKNFHVLVIDNGSVEPATAELLTYWHEREPARFRVLQDASPFNYSRLNNAGVRAADAPFIVLLNNDTEVVSPEWMHAMLGQARRAPIGAVGALLMYDDDTVQHAGVMLGVLGLAGHSHRFLPADGPGYFGALQLDTNYLAVTGACLMVQTSKYWEVGGLDETLVVSYNDVDFCLKLQHAGYRNVVTPSARLYHYESKSRGLDDTSAKVARAMEEAEAIRTRWPVWAVRDPYYNPNLTVDAEDFGLRL
jgi:GT2 family glycosyltransferase